MTRKGIQSQGELDLLCGVYAILNALTVCGIRPSRNAFRECLSALPRSCWPAALWDGISYGHLERMLRGIAPRLRRHGVRVSYPFDEDWPRLEEEYWRRFDDLFADPTARVAILGLRKPHYHWIVARPMGNRVELIDSMPGRPPAIKNRKTLRVGVRNKQAKWLIDPGELIMFHQPHRR